MTQAEKEQFYQRAEELLAVKRRRIAEEMLALPGRLTQVKELKDEESSSGELTYQTMAGNIRKKYNQLEGLYPSPYFNRFKLQFDSEKEMREIFFGKFPFAEEGILSWTSPIAAVRFDSPGRFSFFVDGQNQTGQIDEKDQYLIVDGKIKFLASEKAGHERELIYQEYFSQHKTDFVLPEILAQMEKSQDEVIRAQVKGPLVISGPAGSGKTTLALHRIAYLLQSPDTADSYSQDKIIVFVQDSSTKDYFSGLLPSFGINDVRIETFGEWALDSLDLAGYKSVNRFLDSTKQSNDDEVAKIRALRSEKSLEIGSDSHKALLDYYGEYFTSDQKKYFHRQKQERVLDRLDLTVLLKAHQEKLPLKINKEYYHVAADRTLTRKHKREVADYSLIIVDEFENYMPEQIALIKSMLNKKQSSILYVGDLKQQIYFGAVKAWRDLGDEFMDYDRIDSAEQKNIIRLQKVYRNTKEILSYISSLGFKIEIPEALRLGRKVEEVSQFDQAQEMSWVKEKIVGLSQVSVGILAPEKDYLLPYSDEFSSHDNVRVMPIQEAQGVEFDAVFLVGVDKDILKNNCENLLQDELNQEFWRISRDLLYIAMTRAMNELYVSVK